MSMHLAGHGLNTNYTRKIKSKRVVVNEVFMKDFHEYNKLMRRCKARHKTLPEYIAYREGRSNTKPKMIKGPFAASSYQRPSPVVPSGDSIGVAYTRREQKVYTGGKLMGIATMHKSNSVPIFNQEDAEDIAKMRR